MGKQVTSRQLNVWTNGMSDRDVKYLVATHTHTHTHAHTHTCTHTHTHVHTMSHYIVDTHNLYTQLVQAALPEYSAEFFSSFSSKTTLYRTSP